MAGAPLGNQNAAKAKRWQDALHKALVRFEKEDGSVKAGQALDKIAETVVSQAIAGNKDAWQEIGNRLDGKVPQGIIGGDEDDNPLRFVGRITREIVNANATNPDSESV
jgi:hypothetical protein